MEFDFVILDTLDGFEFEELCAEIYRRLGFDVQNVQATGDEGRDLILTSPDGETIIVECKHWPGRSVGRPILQKLHSAIITYPAKRGALVTTGLFPKSAIAYAGKLSEDVDLVDMPKLKELAQSVGVSLVSTTDPIPLLSYPISDSDQEKRQLDEKLFEQFISSPSKPTEVFVLKQRTARLNAAYLIRYDLTQDFTTAVGRIHNVDVEDEILIVNATDGGCFDGD